MKVIIDDMELKDIKTISRHITDFLKNLGYGIYDLEEIRNEDGKLKGFDYELYRINE